MRIGLIDVDGHHFPNLALMRIARYHKAQGDTVEWWWSDFEYYDIVYKSKVFSDAYSKDVPDPVNVGKVVKGGTGYAISLVDGREVYDITKDVPLPPEIEACGPCYDIYPEYDFAVSQTSRGCPRGCPFCIVGKKEGLAAVKVADVGEFWYGQKKIKILDPNITALPESDKRDLFSQYRGTRALLQFNQGLDIRLLSDDDIADLNTMRLESLHFAWDNPSVDLEPQFANFQKKFKRRLRNLTEVYVLTNYENCSEEEHIERALARIYPLRQLGFNPYVMVYNKPNASQKIRYLQRWCNNKFVFRSCDRFENYDPRRA